MICAKTGCAKVAIRALNRMRVEVMVVMSRMFGGQLGIESEQLGRFVKDAFFLFVERDDVVHAFHVFPEIPFVKLFVEHSFMEGLQLAEGEFLGKHFKSNVF